MSQKINDVILPSEYSYHKVCGALLFVGSAQFLLSLILAEATQPGYAPSAAISNLGVGPSSPIFNSSLLLQGTIGIVAAYFLQRAFRKLAISIFFGFGGIAAMGAALFPVNVYPTHLVFSVVGFFVAGLSPFVTYKTQNPPFIYLSIGLGTLSFSAAVLLALGYSLGLGYGGMERLIAYPTLLWVIGFGGYLMSYFEEKSGG